MTEIIWAKPGIMCLCIDDKPSNGKPLSIRRGQRYTISAVRTNPWLGSSQSTTVLIAEVDEPNEFWLSRFAPLPSDSNAV